MKRNAYFARLRGKGEQETCRCDAYPFPHRSGSGKCEGGEAHVFKTVVCLEPTDTPEFEVGDRVMAFTGKSGSRRDPGNTCGTVIQIQEMRSGVVGVCYRALI